MAACLLTCLLLLGFVSMVAGLKTSKEICFSGDKFLYYSPKELDSSIKVNSNRVELEFRTIHPSGILMAMVGKGKDALVLFMDEGRLR